MTTTKPFLYVVCHMLGAAPTRPVCPTEPVPEYAPNIGDLVIIRAEHRHRFNRDSAAAAGEPLKVHRRIGSMVQLGPRLLDYAYTWELQPAN